MLALGLASLLVGGRASAAPLDGADLGIVDATTAIWGWPAELSAQAGLAWLEVSVVNRGPSPVTDAELVVTLPAGVGADTTNATAGPVGAACQRVEAEVRCGLVLPVAEPAQPLALQLLLVNEGRPAGVPSTIELEVRSSAPDPVPADNRAVVAVTFAGGPMPSEPGTADLAVAPVAGRMAVSAMNRGPGAAGDLEFTIGVPSGVRIVAVDWQGCVVDASAQTARCPIAGFRSPFTWATWGFGLSIEGPSAGTPVTVSVVVASSTSDPDPTNDRAELTMVVTSGGTTPTTITPTQPSGALPATGGSPVVLVVFGAALLLAGALVRRRAQVREASKMLPIDSSST